MAAAARRPIEAGLARETEVPLPTAGTTPSMGSEVAAGATPKATRSPSSPAAGVKSPDGPPGSSATHALLEEGVAQAPQPDRIWAGRRRRFGSRARPGRGGSGHAGCGQRQGEQRSKSSETKQRHLSDSRLRSPVSATLVSARVASAIDRVPPPPWPDSPRKTLHEAG